MAATSRFEPPVGGDEHSSDLWQTARRLHGGAKESDRIPLRQVGIDLGGERLIVAVSTLRRAATAILTRNEVRHQAPVSTERAQSYTRS
jgi:hypothetical protein